MAPGASIPWWSDRLSTRRRLELLSDFGSAMHAKEEALCPSAQPEMSGSVIFAIIGGTPQKPRANYLSETRATDASLLRLSEPVSPTEVFRFAAACAESGCQHYDGARCQLVRRTVQALEPVRNSLPACPIRPRCTWWQQEGKDACVRCPQIVTQLYAPTEQMRAVAQPSLADVETKHQAAQSNGAPDG